MTAINAQPGQLAPSGAVTVHQPPVTFVQRALDPHKAGSVRAQALTGIVGVALALVLVLGQVSLATTKNISRNLHQNVVQLQDGNKTMASVIERSAPSVMMEKTIGLQAESLEHTNETMAALNREMAVSGRTTDELMKTTSAMQRISAQLAAGVKSMNVDTAKMLRLLKTMPGKTSRTQKNLAKLSGDTAAINGEMKAIGAKMQRFGLPQAKNVKRR